MKKSKNLLLAIILKAGKIENKTDRDLGNCWVLRELAVAL